MKEKYLIANNDNTKFIGRDEASGGYPYVTDMFEFCLIGDYDYIRRYYEGLEPYIEDERGLDFLCWTSDFSIKRIVLEDISTY